MCVCVVDRRKRGIGGKRRYGATCARWGESGGALCGASQQEEEAEQENAFAGDWTGTRVPSGRTKWRVTKKQLCMNLHTRRHIHARRAAHVYKTRKTVEKKKNVEFSCWLFEDADPLSHPPFEPTCCGSREREGRGRGAHHSTAGRSMGGKAVQQGDTKTHKKNKALHSSVRSPLEGDERCGNDKETGMASWHVRHSCVRRVRLGAPMSHRRVADLKPLLNSALCGGCGVGAG